MLTNVMRRGLGILVLLFAGSGAALAQPDCALGQRYFALAQDRLAAFASDEAAEYLRQSIKACPTHEAYQQLGEVLAQSPERADQQQAVEAFVAAHELATSDEARARALYRYAQLLAREGDPQNAYPLIKDAQALQPDDPAIATLASNIQSQVEKPTQAQIVRGLKDSLYRPLRVASLTMAASAATATMAKRPPPARTTGPSVNIPINFVTGSTRVDDQTRPNVIELARALSDPGLQGQNFLFVGHADVRGDADRNLDLSRQRAEAIQQAVVLLEPSLDGRIEATGRGSNEPIDYGHDEQAHRANRRLQVLLK